MKKIFRQIYKLPRTIGVAQKLHKAWHFLALGDPQGAERTFEKGERLLFGKMPLEYKIMKGQIKFSVRNHAECHRLFGEAWRELDRDTTFSDDEKSYLKYYMYSAFELYEKHKMFDVSEFDAIAPADVLLENVSTIWKKRFPSRDHPDWREVF